jgi:hypothetical protein
MWPELAVPTAILVAAGVVYARIVIALNRRLNDHAERLARLEGSADHHHRED